MNFMYHINRVCAWYRLLDYLVQIWDTEQAGGLEFRKSGPSTARATVKVRFH